MGAYTVGGCAARESSVRGFVMAKRKQASRAIPNRFATARVLQRVAAAMSPFYKAIACNQRYAALWSKAVVKTDLARLEKLLRLVSPLASKQGISSNGIGYFVSFPVPSPIDNYANGVTIPPGSTQFFFETRVHRSIARSVLPFYLKLAKNNSYAQDLAKAIRRGDTTAVKKLILPRVRTPALKSIAIEDSGVALLFDYPFSKYKYRNLLFRDVI